MSKTLILLPGWGLGIKPLNVLAEELKKLLPDLSVQLQPLPDFSGKSITTVIQQLDQELPQNYWLAGWSLGGMFATALTAQRQTRAAGLISLASNACFVAKDTWPKAMPESTFTEFYKLCQTDLAIGLKRFSLLCSQGSAQPRQLSRQLQAISLTTELNSLELLAGLEMLAKLDNRDAITNFTSPQLHLLAEADALVPVEAVTELQALNAKAAVEVLGHSHASLLAEPQLLAERMAAFIVSNQNA